MQNLKSGVGTAQCACLPARQAVLVSAVLVWAFLGLAGLSFAADEIRPMVPEEEVISIETFFPSPWGSYEVLELHPTNQKSVLECDSADERGKLYYNDFDNKVYVCKGEFDGWQELGDGVPSNIVFASFGSPCPTGSTTVGRYYTGSTICGGGKCCNPGGGWVRPGDPIPSCPVQMDGTSNAAYGSTNNAIPTNDYLCAKV